MINLKIQMDFGPKNYINLTKWQQVVQRVVKKKNENVRKQWRKIY